MAFFSSVTQQEKVDFVKNLFVMLQSGIAINEALATLSKQTKNTSFRRSLTHVNKSVINGMFLSEAFEKEKKIFGDVFISLVRAGEKSGTLQENLQFLSDWLERNADLKREVNAATLYPKLVFGAAVVLGGSLAVFILPKLVPFFSQLNVDLPFTTRVVLATSLFIEQHWFLFLLLLAAVFIGFFLLNRIRFVKRVLHRIYIQIPFIGTMLRNYQLALFSQLFATLLKSGLTIGESISIIEGAVSNIHYKESIRTAGQRIDQGTTLSDAIRERKDLYPRSVISIVATGEKTGNLANSFSHLADFYGKEVRIQAKKLPTIIEPALLIIIALIVGFVALSIIMPIYELTGSISR